MSDPAAPLRHHASLDGLRAIAVTMVVLFHAGATSGLPGLLPGGFIGVSVFFTISGFLVTSILLRESASTESGGVDFGRFWARRVKRLWPASLVVVVLTVVLASTYWNGMQASDAIAGVFGYMNWHVIWSGQDALLRTIVGPLGPYWSLAIEEQFYVLLTVAFVVCLRVARPIRWLTIVVVVGWFGSLLAQLLISGPQYRLEFGTDTRGSEILAGCGLAILLHVRPELTDRFRTWLPAVGAIALGAIVVIAATNDYDPPWLLRGGYSALSLVERGARGRPADPAPVDVGLGVAPVGRDRCGQLLDLPHPLARDPDPHRRSGRLRELGSRRRQGRRGRRRGHGAPPGDRTTAAPGHGPEPSGRDRLGRRMSRDDRPRPRHPVAHPCPPVCVSTYPQGTDLR